MEEEPNPLEADRDPGVEEETDADRAVEDNFELLVGVEPFEEELTGELALMDARVDSLTLWANGSPAVLPGLGLRANAPS